MCFIFLDPGLRRDDEEISDLPLVKINVPEPQPWQPLSAWLEYRLMSLGD
jgi:hypothetical protein